VLGVKSIEKGHRNLDDLRARLFGHEQPRHSIAGRQVQVSAPDSDEDDEDDEGDEGKWSHALPAIQVFPSDFATADAFLALRASGKSNWRRSEAAELVAIIRVHMKVKVDSDGKKSAKSFQNDAVDRAQEVALACMFLDSPSCKDKYAKGVILAQEKQ